MLPKEVMPEGAILIRNMSDRLQSEIVWGFSQLTELQGNFEAFCDFVKRQASRHKQPGLAALPNEDWAALYVFLSGEKHKHNLAESMGFDWNAARHWI